MFGKITGNSIAATEDVTNEKILHFKNFLENFYIF